MFARIIVPVIVCLTFASVRVASACSPPVPALGDTIPTDGGVHPANAAVQMKGDYLGASVSGTIDGEPVDVVIDTELSLLRAYSEGNYYNVMVVRTSPQPEPGQVVHLFGEPCAKSGVGCTLDLTYTAGALDMTPPLAPTIYADFYDQGEVATYYDYDASCWGEDVAARYSFEVRVQFPQEKGLLRQIGLIRGDTNETLDGISSDSQGFMYYRKDWSSDPGYFPSLKGAAQVVDLAGNRSGVMLAEPCHHQVYDGEPCADTESCEPLEIPVYTCDGIINRFACEPEVLAECPEATTDGESTDTESTTETGEMASESEAAGSSDGMEATSMGGTDTSGIDGDDRGCACTSGDSSGMGAWLLVLVAGLRRRRTRS